MNAKTLFVLAALVSGICCQAQIADRKKTFEFGVAIAAIEPPNDFNYAREGINYSLLNGLYLKMRRNEHMFRAAAFYSQQRFFFPTGFFNSGSAINRKLSTGATVGYQWLPWNYWLGFFLCADLTYGYNESVSSFNDVFASSTFAPFVIGKYYEHQVGLDNGVGLRVRAGKNLVINLESKIVYRYIFRHRVNSPVSKMTGHLIDFSPLSLTFGFTF